MFYIRICSNILRMYLNVHRSDPSSIRSRRLSMMCECVFTCTLVLLFLVTTIVYIVYDPDSHVIDYIVKVRNNSVNESIKKITH